ncbi:hypothetical protein D3C79_820420 [compost metagenome]
MQQLPMEVQLHAIFQPLFELAQCAAQVVPGVAVRGTRRQHRAGQQHRHRQAQQQERQCCSAVGQAVGAMQHQHAIMASHLYRCDDGIAHRQPVVLLHVGAVEQRV